jgi:hypothetical protein
MTLPSAGAIVESMRTFFSFTLALFLASSVSHAEALRSPRLAALAKQLAAHEPHVEDALWRQLAAEGTPIIEAGNEPGHALVSFVWRGNAATRRVQLFVSVQRDASHRTVRLIGAGTPGSRSRRTGAAG